VRIPPSVAAGGISGDEQEELRPAGILPAARDTVEQYLRDLVDRGGADVPLIDQLVESDLGTPRATASIARAALSVLRAKSPDVIRADLVRDLAEDDLLARVRIKAMIGDLGGAPWQRLGETNTARRLAGDFRYRKGAA